MLLTEQYKSQISAMHKKKGWGDTGGTKAKRLTSMAQSLGASSILDYGCGEGLFKIEADKLATGISVSCYDPAMPDFCNEPEGADFVVCIDVLEHVEPDCLDHVLWHIQSLMNVGGYLMPCLVEAGAKLPDGRNAHLIIENAEWWVAKAEEFFDVQVDLKTAFHVGMIIRPKALQV